MSLLIAMSLFSLSMSITPGPVNVLTLSAGVNHGLTSSMPFVIGASLGFTVLLIFVGLGVSPFVDEASRALHWMSVFGCCFIGYLGYKVFVSVPELEVNEGFKPTFLQGAILQWLNPKAWLACLSGVSAFNVAGSYSTLTIFAGVYFVICFCSISCWAFAGSKIRDKASTTPFLVWLNRCMGLGLMLVALYLVLLAFLS